MLRRSSDIFLDRSSTDISLAIRDALVAFDEGFGVAFSLLTPLVEGQNPAALFYASRFSQSNEPNEKFGQRSLQQLSRSAELGYAPAIHELAIQYDSGSELVPQDKKKAASLFRMAAEAGHPHSQWIYGLDLLEGKNGIEKDDALGHRFILDSAAAKFEAALESLAIFHEHGEYGFPVDLEKSKFFKCQLDDVDVLSY